MPHQTPPTFFFEGYQYDFKKHTAIFCYSYGKNHQFKEKITFNSTSDSKPKNLNDEEKQALKKTLDLLYLASGVSYFKIFFPKNIIIKGIDLSQETTTFLNNFYTQGLGEYAFVNNLKIKGMINFPVTLKTQGKIKPNQKITLPRKTAVPIGGGKDSIVTLELLKKNKEPLVLFIVGDAQPLFSTIKIANLPYIQVQREVDKKLFSLNKTGVKNGHVPITGLISMIAAVSAIIYGFDTIVMSNERSANTGNVLHNGQEVNHQYSKSLDFEKKFSDYIRKNFPINLNYFSILRPLSELAISRIFSNYPQYHSSFRSCGISYKQEKKKRLSGWCANCAKCRFIFLSLALFVDKNKLTSIFGKNLLNDPQQTIGYRELTGLEGHRPFDCVGEIEESLFVFSEMIKSPLWKKDRVVLAIKKELKNKKIQINSKKIFNLSNNHIIPKKYLTFLEKDIAKIKI